MWQRYNQTSHIFEKSVDNGASWLPLPLSGAIITEGTIPNVAYKNINNQFSISQTIDTATPRLVLNDPTRPVDQRKFDLLSSTSLFYIRALNDADTVSLGQLVMDRLGNIDTTGSTIGLTGAYPKIKLSATTPAYIQNTNFGYENLVNAYYNGTTWTLGNAAVPSWLLRLSSSLDSIVIHRAPAGSVAFAPLIEFTNAGAIKERGRSVALGDWTAFAPVLTATAGTVTLGTNFYCGYTVKGKTATVNYYLGVTISATPGTVFINLPAGVVPSNYSANACLVADGFGMVQVAPGDGRLNLYRLITGAGAFPAGSVVIGGSLEFPIQ